MARAPKLALPPKVQAWLMRTRTLVRDWVVRVFRKPWDVFVKICFGIGLAVLVVLFLTAGYVTVFFRSLPNVQKIGFENLKEIGRQRVVDRLENKQARYEWTPLRDVSREFLYSVVVSEDASFFEHSGFNLEMMLSSMAENIKEGKSAYGASTISQQVAKNLFLSNEKTYLRKIKEFFITQRLENALKKNEIAELYLNVAEFGPDIFGVAAASKHYFNTTPAKINAAQGAFIALMLPSPKRHYFSIFQNRNLTKAKLRRVERVLRDMLYEEYLSETQYHRYSKYNYFPDVNLSSSRSPAGRSSR